MKSCIALVIVVALVVVATLPACAPDAPDQPGARVAVSVAPLTLPGISNARYTLEIHNGDGDLVATREVTSVAYGAGDGSLSYVAPCDADPAVSYNSVSLTLLDVYGGASGQAVIDRSTYANPGTVTRQVTCEANADVAVTFDLTIARQANQGFFDVAVSFSDIFCSAKLDCVDQDGAAIKLLHDPSGHRATTLVTALACTGGVTGGDTVLYRDPVVLDCGGSGVATVDPDGAGNLAYGAGITGDPVLFGAAVTRGDEQLGFTKRYWNVMLGLVDGTPGCTLTTRATASRGAFDADTTPAGTTYPFIVWDVPVTDGSGALVCTHHPVNGAPTGVATTYTAADTPRTFTSAWSGAATVPNTPPPAAAAGICDGWDYCWHLDDASGTTAVDSGSQGADGTLYNGPTWATGYADGGLYFNGSTSYVSAPDGIFSTTQDALSTVAWLKWDGLNGDDWSAIITGRTGWEFGIASATELLTYWEIGRSAVVSCPFAAADYAGAWHQVAMTVSTSQGRARVYIDGVMCDEVAYSGAIHTTDGAVQQGVYDGGLGDEQEHLLGTLDEVRLGARELGSADIAALYAAESGATPASAPQLASCKALFDAGYGVDGVYTIDPDGPDALAARDVYCDMANGGWTLAGRQLASATTWLGGEARNSPGDATFSSDLTGVPFSEIEVFNQMNGEAFTQSFGASTWSGATSGQQQVGSSAPVFRQGQYGDSTVMGCVNYSQSNLSNSWACDNDSTAGQRGHIAGYAGEYCPGGRLDGTWAWTNGSSCSLRGQLYTWGIAIR